MDPKRKLKAVDQKLKEHADAIEKVWDKAREDGHRETTDEERQDIAEHLKSVDTLQQQKSELEDEVELRKSVNDLAGNIGATEAEAPRVKPQGDVQDRMIKSLGEVFTDSVEFKGLQETFKSTGRLPQGMTTGIVSLETKGTLMEGPGGGGGALAAPVPQVVPGVVEKLFQPLTFADLLLSGQASTNSFRYVVEGTATSGAAGVAEGGLKPQSTLGLTTSDEPIKKIATSLKIADEMLEDAPAVQSYINGRLGLFVRIEEERQLIRGTSGGNEVQGLLTSRGVPVYAGGTAVGNRAIQLFKAMNGLRGSALVEPEWLVVHPTDWEAIRLLTDNQAQFYGGGPFQGPYGSGSNLSASGQITGAQDSIWNKPTYVTGVVGAGTAIVGTTASAQVWRRGGLSVEATNSNEDDFLRNLVALRAEERLGLAVYRPTGYVEVRLS